MPKRTFDTLTSSPPSFNQSYRKTYIFLEDQTPVPKTSLIQNKDKKLYADEKEVVKLKKIYKEHIEHDQQRFFSDSNIPIPENTKTIVERQNKKYVDGKVVVTFHALRQRAFIFKNTEYLVPPPDIKKIVYDEETKKLFLYGKEIYCNGTYIRQIKDYKKTPPSVSTETFLPPHSQDLITQASSIKSLIQKTDLTEEGQDIIKHYLNGIIAALDAEEPTSSFTKRLKVQNANSKLSSIECSSIAEHLIMKIDAIISLLSEINPSKYMDWIKFSLESVDAICRTEFYQNNRSALYPSLFSQLPLNTQDKNSQNEKKLKCSK